MPAICQAVRRAASKETGARVTQHAPAFLGVACMQVGPRDIGVVEGSLWLTRDTPCVQPNSLLPLPTPVRARLLSTQLFRGT
jgi:hypothetical protein